jgi:hypothetical protein
VDDQEEMACADWKASTDEFFCSDDVVSPWGRFYKSDPVLSI